MLNKISLVILAAAGAIISGAAIPAYACTPAADACGAQTAAPKSGETAIQSSTYDFKAIYGGQDLHKFVDDAASGKLYQNDYLHSNSTDLLKKDSASSLHKVESGSATSVKSGLVMQAIPGTNYGMVDLGGSRTSYDSYLNMTGSSNTKIYTESSLDKKSGMEKGFENAATHKQDANGYNFGEGSFNATQFGFHGF